MLFNRLGSALVIFAFLVASPSLRSQEAVDVERSPTPAEEATPETTKPKATPAKPAKSLEETMRPDEFKAAGLDKLSEDELQHLDAYLQGYRQAAQKKATEQAQAKANEEIKKANEKAEKAEQATAEVKKNARIDSLVSRVAGNIEGIKGHTIIRLEDGTVWKQANADDRFRASVSDRPGVVVTRTYLGYKMRIEGMPEFYVDPVVRPQ